MNKDQFIKAVAERAEISQKQTKNFLDFALAVIQETVASGDSVDFIGFGSFLSVELKAREGRNPTTGETIDIPKRVTPKFKAGKTFKDLVAGK
jgi:DNA-binding protein HU-beta